MFVCAGSPLAQWSATVRGNVGVSADAARRTACATMVSVSYGSSGKLSGIGLKARATGNPNRARVVPIARFSYFCTAPAGFGLPDVDFLAGFASFAVCPLRWAQPLVMIRASSTGSSVPQNGARRPVARAFSRLSRQSCRLSFVSPVTGNSQDDSRLSRLKLAKVRATWNPNRVRVVPIAPFFYFCAAAAGFGLPDGGLLAGFGSAGV